MTKHTVSPPNSASSTGLEDIDPDQYDPTDAGITKADWDAVDIGDPIVYKPYGTEVAIGRRDGQATATVENGTSGVTCTTYMVSKGHVIEVLDE